MLKHPSTHLIPPKSQNGHRPSSNFSIVSCRLPHVGLSSHQSVHSNYDNGSAFQKINGFEKINGGKGMKWFHEMKLGVRDHECDMYGMMNNAAYANYCEHGHYELSEMLGIKEDDAVAVTELSLKYIAPLRRGDRFLLKVRLYDFSAVRLYYENLFFKLPNLEPILEAKSTIVWLDKNYRPTRIPRRFISLIPRS